MKYIVSRTDELLDQIVFNYYGTEAGYLEKILSCNTHLYELNAILPKNTIINLPEITAGAKLRVKLL